MAERPILFSAPMVCAILAGQKTQTRRVVKPQPHASNNPQHAEARGAGWVWMAHDDRPTYTFATGDFRCPYGQPGDRLWVRETHMDLGACYLYRADPGAEDERAMVAPGQRWKPAIHMPRAASRITLEITGVRVERLQDISIADAMAEGVVETRADLRGLEPCMEWRYAYEDLWESINGAGSWGANPWVWVLEFRRADERGAA